jgi:hypothetical protein
MPFPARVLQSFHKATLCRLCKNFANFDFAIGCTHHATTMIPALAANPALSTNNSDKQNPHKFSTNNWVLLQHHQLLSFLPYIIQNPHRSYLSSLSMFGNKQHTAMNRNDQKHVCFQ